MKEYLCFDAKDKQALLLLESTMNLGAWKSSDTKCETCVNAEQRKALPDVAKMVKVKQQLTGKQM